MSIKSSVLTETFILKINFLVSSPGSKTLRRGTKATCNIIVLLEMKYIVAGLKMGQWLNKVAKNRLYVVQLYLSC